MSRMELLRHAVRLWNIPYVPRETNKANARKWIKAVERLGDRWLLARKVGRIV